MRIRLPPGKAFTSANKTRKLAGMSSALTPEYPLARSAPCFARAVDQGLCIRAASPIGFHFTQRDLISRCETSQGFCGSWGAPTCGAGPICRGWTRWRGLSSRQESGAVPTDARSARRPSSGPKTAAGGSRAPTDCVDAKRRATLISRRPTGFVKPRSATGSIALGRVRRGSRSSKSVDGCICCIGGHA